MKKCTTNKEEKETYLNILHFVVQLARTKNWTHFIQWGTLLGSWRHHSMTPCDLDLDMYFDLKDRDDIIKSIATQNEFIAKQMLYRKKELKLYSRFNSTVINKVRGLGEWKSPYMDLYFFSYTLNGYVKCATLGEGYWLKSDIFPLQNRPFEDMTVPAPRNPLKILQQMYGKTGKCKIRMRGSRITYRCQDLDGFYPFVYRNFSNGTLVETLKLGTKIIQIKNFFNTTAKDLKLPLNPFTLDNLGCRAEGDWIFLVLTITRVAHFSFDNSL
jgi:phosphorylcholine metabolism protein LicD